MVFDSFLAGYMWPRGRLLLRRILVVGALGCVPTCGGRDWPWRRGSLGRVGAGTVVAARGAWWPVTATIGNFRGVSYRETDGAG